MDENALIDNSRRYVLVEIKASFDLLDTPTSVQACIRDALETLRGMGAAKVSYITHYDEDPRDNFTIWGKEEETSLKVYVPTELEFD